MTFYNDTNFPDDISYGSKGGPMFNTTVIKLKSGHEQRNVNWQYPLHMYDVAYGVKTQAQMSSLRSFFLAMFGQAHTFRFKDWHDYTTHVDGNSAPTYTDAIASTANVNGQFQIVKRYTVGTATMKRRITTPIAATVSVAFNGVETTSFSLNSSSGVFTINGASSNIASISQAVSAIVSTVNVHAFNTGDTIYFQAVSGMTEVNGNRYTVTDLAGRRLKLNVNSTGFGAYVNGGVGINYPASTEASVVTVGCEFDVPCRFDSDVFDPVHDDYNITQLQIQVTEVRT